MFLVLYLPLTLSVFSSSKEVRKIISRVAGESGLELPSELQIRFVTPAELEKVFFQDFMFRHPPEILREESRLLRMIGLFKRDVDLSAQFAKVIKGNIKAYFQDATGQLLIDQTLPFEDEYSLGALIVEIRLAMTKGIRKKVGPQPGRFFTDENWMDYALYNGDATFVMHNYYGDNPEVLASMDGMSLIAKNPMVSAATGFKLEPLIGRFYTQGLIQGVNHAWQAFKKKSWKGLNQCFLNPPEMILDYWLVKPLKNPPDGRFPDLPRLNGFDRVNSGRVGLFLLASFMDKTPLVLMTELGCCGEQFSVERKVDHEGELLQWKMAWLDGKSARDAFLMLCDRYEVLLKARFEDGVRKGKAFRAGRDECGAYVMVRHEGSETLVVRSFDRRTINRFIENAQY